MYVEYSTQHTYDCKSFFFHQTDASGFSKPNRRSGGCREVRRGRNRRKKKKGGCREERTGRDRQKKKGGCREEKGEGIVRKKKKAVAGKREGEGICALSCTKLDDRVLGTPGLWAPRTTQYPQHPNTIRHTIRTVRSST